MTQPDPATPPYLMLAASLRQEIRSGALKPGDRIRSVNQLASDYGLSVATIQKAIRVLKDEGLIIGAQGYGMFVTEPSPGETSHDRRQGRPDRRG